MLPPEGGAWHFTPSMRWKDAGEVQGIAVSGAFQRGVTYQIISGDSSPAASYASLAICFAPGHRDRHAARPRRARGSAGLRCSPDAGCRGAAPGSQERYERGPEWGLTLSPQHRNSLYTGGNEGILPVKTLLGHSGIHPVQRLVQRWHHLLFARHHLILAEGASLGLAAAGKPSGDPGALPGSGRSGGRGNNGGA